MTSLYNGLYVNFKHDNSWNNSNISYMITLIKRLKTVLISIS